MTIDLHSSSVSYARSESTVRIAFSCLPFTGNGMLIFNLGGYLLGVNRVNSEVRALTSELKGFEGSEVQPSEKTFGYIKSFKERIQNLNSEIVYQNKSFIRLWKYFLASSLISLAVVVAGIALGAFGTFGIALAQYQGVSIALSAVVLCFSPKKARIPQTSL